MSYRVGYTTGVFDLFHVGHLNILQRAKGMCEKLLVGVTTDELAEALKGRRPAVEFSERIRIVESVRFVDGVVAQEEMNEISDWRRLRFDVIFKGDDWRGTPKWTTLQNEFHRLGVAVVFFPYTATTSSTLVREYLRSGIARNRGGEA
ncbi:MAG: glycerol-3-phosphate cytidylyltransferase [Puniceicoccaceae bacterium]|nr:MAG: glycerol-3-phosphate cytidylyltransferase [Puniceicoccaceae bacterium]